MAKKKSKLPLYLSLALLVALLITYFIVPDFKNFIDTAWSVLTSKDEQKTEEWIGQFGLLGPVVIVIAMVVQMFLLVIPSFILMVVSVLAYGPVWGSLLIIISIFCASSVGYWFGSYFGAPLVERLLGVKSEKKIERFIDKYGFGAVIVARLSPILSNDAISFVGGMLHMGYWRYIGATVLGILPLTFFIAYLGQNTEKLKSGMLWVSVVGLVTFIGYIIYDKQFKKG
ncbi:TVP38/TMEM64 family protein [Fulvivirga sp. RKSG066]|uniref:VTT domain-containing protein n=1 Tax=Fulvivirga aurantia TaxID=2529383 RepID=UPI00162382AA|nr:TVP38/TMEM64 family protein [Fulvivirga aurantia]